MLSSIKRYNHFFTIWYNISYQSCGQNDVQAEPAPRPGGPFSRIVLRLWLKAGNHLGQTGRVHPLMGIFPIDHLSGVHVPFLCSRFWPVRFRCLGRRNPAPELIGQLPRGTIIPLILRRRPPQKASRQRSENQLGEQPACQGSSCAHDGAAPPGFEFLYNLLVYWYVV